MGVSDDFGFSNQRRGLPHTFEIIFVSLNLELPRIISGSILSGYMKSDTYPCDFDLAWLSRLLS